MAKKDRTGNRKTREQRRQFKVPELGYYLIVTDTEATERCFFTGLHQALPEDVRNKLVIKVVETKTRTMIDKCLELTAYDAQYRIPWIVFDRDQVQGFDEIIAEAVSKGIQVGWSNPCFTRHTLHSSSKYENPVWYCRNAANKGKHNCPNSKSVHESILENAFLEACKLLAGSFDDVINSAVDVIEDISTSNEDIGRLKKEQKAMENLEQRRKKLTDLDLDEGISKEAYDEKYEDISVKIQKSKENIAILQENVSNQKDVSKRMASLKKALSDGNVLDEFDRVAFESIVDKVIVGETNDDGTVDPFKLTFVMKGNGNSVVPNTKDWFKGKVKEQADKADMVVDTAYYVVK